MRTSLALATVAALSSVSAAVYDANVSMSLIYFAAAAFCDEN